MFEALSDEVVSTKLSFMTGYRFDSWCEGNIIDARAVELGIGSDRGR